MLCSRALSFSDHTRDRFGLRYVYAVLSRRAQGLSVGVNLSPSQICNWRCVYCQVPGLSRGRPAPIDLSRLEQELEGFLRLLLGPGPGTQAYPAELRDVAFSGDGEPTLCPEFPAAVEIVGQVLRSLDLLGSLPLVLITNGWALHRSPVQAAVGRMADLGGRVWFKLDRATPQGIRQVNGVALPVHERLEKLRKAALLAPTWVQTCMTSWDGAPPPTSELDAYLDCLAGLVADRVPLRGVLLYTIARPSAQPEGAHVGPLSAEWLMTMASQIERLGLEVQVSA